MAPAKAHRKQGGLSAPLRKLTKSKKIASAGTGGVVVVAVIVLLATNAFGHPKQTAARGHGGGPPATVKGTVPVKKTDSDLCPLTGLPAPGGKVPARPAIGIKIGNDPASRPQSGLPHADIVYEEMAEGGITRYLAIFQCHQAPVLGPSRSVRWDDWHVLRSYGHPILAFSGGINQWDTVVSRLHWLYDANGSFYPAANAYYRTSNRVAPWNLYTSTARLWALDKSEKSPPPAQFTYDSSLPSGFEKAKQVTIVDFSGGESVVWKWNAKAGVFERYYGSEPDRDASGVQLHAKNVVIQMVVTHQGPYAESGNTPDTDSITRGKGVAYVFRNGHFEKGVWDTPTYRQPLGLYLKGKKVPLDPGNTWVEMVPVTYSVQVQR